jgi:hypothetical protein
MSVKALTAKIIILFSLFFIFAPKVTTASESVFVTDGSTRGRALAMGSAYSSLEDDFSSGLYNPAAFRLNAARNEPLFRIFFNPLGSASAFYDFSHYNRDFILDNKLTGIEALLSLSMLFKGMVIATPAFDFGICLNEDILGKDSTFTQPDHFFSIERNTKGGFHSSFLNLKVAPSISVGLTGTLYDSWKDGHYQTGTGYTFGVLLNPNPKMKIGLTYYEIPSNFSDGRSSLENIEGGTATGGISYYPDPKTVISVDVRNLYKENKGTAREIHSGLEHVFLQRIALRAGYFQKKTTIHNVYSAGIGILPAWGRISKYVNTSRSDIFSYSFILEEGLPTRHWHTLSLLFRY